MLNENIKKLIEAYKNKEKIKAIGETDDCWILSIKDEKVYFQKTKIN